MKNAILIAGPTASGKSALAVAVAERAGGIVVNADSMQVYSVLKVLTARPADEDLLRVPHALYGHVDPAANYSTGTWLREVADLAAKGAFFDRVPVFTGGTGLYFTALTEGLSEMPDVPEATRVRWRYRLKEEGAEKLHRVLMLEDPKAATHLRTADGQRIVRALEVLESSGRSILDWQNERGRPLVDRASARLFVIEPDRGELARRIDTRFDKMVDAGAIEEARAIETLGLDDAKPAMKAIGVRELIAADAGEISIAEAVERATAATRQYAKRQMTWFRNQFGQQWARTPMPDTADATFVRSLFGQR